VGVVITVVYVGGLCAKDVLITLVTEKLVSIYLTHIQGKTASATDTPHLNTCGCTDCLNQDGLLSYAASQPSVCVAQPVNHHTQVTVCGVCRSVIGSMVAHR
jgi:hypothetical protein